MGSIKKESIETFELAAEWISCRWSNELFKEHNQKMKFCAFSLKKTLKIALNNDWTRTNYSLPLQTVLEEFDKWATTHASQDQENNWSDISKPYVQTCFETHLQDNSNHEALESVGDLIKRFE